MEGKLADHEDISSGLHDGKVHDAVVVIEDPEVCNFTSQPNSILSRVTLFHTDKNEQSPAYRARNPAFNLDFCSLYPLYDRTHEPTIHTLRARVMV